MTTETALNLLLPTWLPGFLARLEALCLCYSCKHILKQWGTVMYQTWKLIFCRSLIRIFPYSYY